MKILLINPPWYCLQNVSAPAMPIGLCYLGAILKENRYECVIYDGDLGYRAPPNDFKITSNYKYYHEMIENHSVWTKAEKVVSEFNPDICGITLTTGAYGSAKKIADIIKKYNKKIPIVLGGPHPTLLPRETLEGINADIVVRGEGEFTFLEIVNCLKSNLSLNNVSGITYRTNNGQIIHNPPRIQIESLDSLPFPARDVILEKEKYKHVSIIGSRGCPFNCTYCASNNIWGRKVRYRSAENIVLEIKKVVSEFGIKYFRFNDDTFTINEPRLFKLCSLLIKENLCVTWVCYARADTISEEMLTIMKRAGCVGIFIGVESGDEDVLKAIKKGITEEQVKISFKIARNVGIPASAYFMIGFPGETRDQVLKTISLMKAINPAGFSCWSVVTPYPGTELYEIAKSMKLIPENPDWSDFFPHSETMNLSKMSRDEIQELINKIQKDIKFMEKRKAMKQYIFYLKHPVLLSRKIINKICNGSALKIKNLPAAHKRVDSTTKN